MMKTKTFFILSAAISIIQGLEAWQWAGRSWRLPMTQRPHTQIQLVSHNFSAQNSPWSTGIPIIQRFIAILGV